MGCRMIQCDITNVNWLYIDFFIVYMMRMHIKFEYCTKIVSCLLLTAQNSMPLHVSKDRNMPSIWGPTGLC